MNARVNLWRPMNEERMICCLIPLVKLCFRGLLLHLWSLAFENPHSPLKKRHSKWLIDTNDILVVRKWTMPKLEETIRITLKITPILLCDGHQSSLTVLFAKDYLFYRHFIQKPTLEFKNPFAQRLPLWGSRNKKTVSQLPVLNFAKEGRLRGSNHSLSPRFHIFNVGKLNLYPSITSFHTQNIPTRHGIWICVICEIDLQLVLALTGPFVWFQRSSDISKGRRIVSASAELVVQSRLGSWHLRRI